MEGVEVEELEVGRAADLHRAAEQLLRSNIRRGPRGRNSTLPELREYLYVCPSPSVYPHQWLWDSCFHAIVMARFDAALAQAEIATIVSLMRSDGFIPHLKSWPGPSALPVLDGPLRWLKGKLHHANLTQPPVLAIALERVFEQSGDEDFLARLLPSVKQHYRYLAQYRDPDGDGLVSIIAPIESGMDHSPAYDEILGLDRPGVWRYHAANLKLAFRYALANWDLTRILDADLFSVEDVGFNCIYAAGLRAVARLCLRLGQTQDSREFTQLADTVESAILTRCYDPEDQLFYSIYTFGNEERKARVKTVASLLPLILETLPSRQVDNLISQYLMHEDFFATPFPVPSVAVREAEFCPGGNCLSQPDSLLGSVRHLFHKYQMVWRGPTWINTNWFIALGLRLHGRHQFADVLAKQTAAMVQRAGFWEFYHPITGSGLGAPNFGWSTLAVDMLDSCPRAGDAPALIAGSPRAS